MSAIKNVGEFASPYYLIEVWAQQQETAVDRDLKRAARALVRDALGFEMRGEEPDDDWRARREALFGFDGLDRRPVRLADGSEFPLSVWRDGAEVDALLVAQLPSSVEPDRRPADESDPPATRFELGLDAYDGEADWGLLLAGLEARIYRRSSGISQQYLAVHLDSLVELDDEASWRAFAGVFRAPAFVPDADGVPRVRRVVEESRRHATALAEDMRKDVVAAAEALIQGALDHPANTGLLRDPSRMLLQRLFEQTLYYLYRVLFCLYAEARDVLPASDDGPYATTYSLDHLVELARREPEHADGTYFSDTLCRLFGLLWQGPRDGAASLRVEPVGGELFDPARTELLDGCVIGDPSWRAALKALAFGTTGSRGDGRGRRASFAELGVDRLGSIYEGLLVLEPQLVRSERVLVMLKGERRVLPPEDVGDARVERLLPPGTFILESASGRRKGSGSFYTPAEITEYLARAALDPLTESILAQAAADPGRAEKAILELRVCDPAMGSGAFLVQAARVLALALARARALGGDGRVTPPLVDETKREVVRRCLYGVDVNPLAVALAKVSLWLETLEPHRPLSFLDAHLRCGDSLVGVDVIGPLGAPSDELAIWPKDAVAGLKDYLGKEAGERGADVLKELRARRRPSNAGGAQLSFDADAVPEALARLAHDREQLLVTHGDGTLDSEADLAAEFAMLEHREDLLRNRLRAACDFWCAQWFSGGEDTVALPAGGNEFEQVQSALLRGEQIEERLQPHLEAARATSARRRFFHWALEFPEVMVDRHGFDAVLGNPPWNTLSPDTSEFYGTYDPRTFRKGVPKARKTERKAELREDPEIDAAWRSESRYLYELSAWAKPKAERFTWYAPDPQLRKGDANVFRLFVERGYGLLRPGGRLAQVLPDSVYVSSPATGIRQHLIEEGRLERVYVFENRKEIFPIHRSVKVVLLVAERNGGPTERFRAAFRVGKDAAGGDRAVGLGELPAMLADLDDDAPELAVADVRALSPETWSFPELQTALDAEIAARCARELAPLNLDECGWGLRYCRELDADKDAWRFREADQLPAGSTREGLRWRDPDGREWWPLVEGGIFYHLEFPAEGKDPTKWVLGPEIRAIDARQNDDGSSVTEHYRVGWRDVASATNERSAIATVLPPKTAAKDSSLTVWGGSLDRHRVLVLATTMSSFCFDYLVRFGGKTHLKYGAVNSIPTPSFDLLTQAGRLAAEVVCRNDEFDDLWAEIRGGERRPDLDAWTIGERRAQLDALVSRAYGLSLEEYAAILSTFPLLDRKQPMLPGEPKSFVTRDLALLAFCNLHDLEPPDVAELLASIGVELPPPRPELRRLDLRVARARELGAIPYRPTPRGGRAPDDPEVVEAVLATLTIEPQSAAEIAEAFDDDEPVVKRVLERLVREDVVYAEGSGRRRRYYVLEEEEEE